MGAWSEDIFGNDAAMDTLCEIEKILGAGELPPGKAKPRVMTRARIAANKPESQDGLLKHVQAEDDLEFKRITAQVVCATLMMIGAEISPELR